MINLKQSINQNSNNRIIKKYSRYAILILLFTRFVNSDLIEKYKSLFCQVDSDEKIKIIFGNYSITLDDICNEKGGLYIEEVVNFSSEVFDISKFKNILCNNNSNDDTTIYVLLEEVYNFFPKNFFVLLRSNVNLMMCKKIYIYCIDVKLGEKKAMIIQ